MNPRRVAVALAITGLAGSRPRAAAADEAYEEYYPIGGLQVGAGIGFHQRAAGGEVTPAFDATVRSGLVYHVGSRFHVGGFGEVHLADHAELAFGPQLQIQLGNLTGVQLRAGLGGSTAGTSVAQVGIQLGNPLLGVTVTGRRTFGDATYGVAVDVELGWLLALLPALRAR